MYKVSRVNAKVERSSTFTFAGHLSYIASNLFTRVKFTRVRMYKLRAVEIHLKSGFPLTRFWLRMLTHVNFNHVNKIEARYKVLRSNVKLSDVLLLRLRAFFHILPLFYLRT